MGGLLLVGVAGGDLVLVEITVGLRGQLQTELIVRILTFRFDLDVVQGDDTRQGRRFFRLSKATLGRHARCE